MEQKGFAPILILLVIFLIGVAAVVGYKIIPKPSGVEYLKSLLVYPRPTPTPTPEQGCYYEEVQCIKAPCPPILRCPAKEKGTAETASWRTHTDNYDNYSIEYPSEWFLYGSSEMGNGTDISSYDLSSSAGTKYTDTNHIRVNIIAFKNTENDTLSKWLEKNSKEQVYSQEKIVGPDGNSGIIREESNSDFLQLGVIDKAIAVYYSHEGKVYRILAFPANSDKREIFNQILSTFKFTQ